MAHPGKHYLSSTTATKIYFNPKYKELQKLGKLMAAMHGVFMCRLPSTKYEHHLHREAEQSTYLTVVELKNVCTRAPAKVTFVLALYYSFLIHPNYMILCLANLSLKNIMNKQTFFCKATIQDVLSSERWSFQPCNSCPTILQSRKEKHYCSQCKIKLMNLIKR